MTGAAAVAAALKRFGFDVQVGVNHKWERELTETGIPAEQIVAALNASGFDIGDALKPPLIIQKAAAFARTAVAAEKDKEPVYDWRGGHVVRKPRGHVCDKDATCEDSYAFRVKTLDGKPLLLCGYHHRLDAPKAAFKAYWDRVEPDREATSRWADEMARAFSRMPKMPEAQPATVDERVGVCA